MQPEVSVHLIVYNGAKYIRKCLESVKQQTYPNITFRIFNNASTDGTVDIAKNLWPGVELISFPKNYVLGGGFNRSLYYSNSPYVVGLSVDVLLAPDFIARAVEAMEAHLTMGVLQAKVFRYTYEQDLKTSIIDTTGMVIFKSRRVINRGHGEEDREQYEEAGEVFSYEGAVPFFRRAALEDAKLQKYTPYYAPYAEKNDTSRYPYEYLDEDFVWYADEVDLGWRMRILGWGSWYEPSVLAWHDRQTTHRLSGGYRNFIRERRTIPAFKRKLDTRNLRLAIVKNDSWSTVLLHVPWILKRELLFFLYVLIWERSSLSAYFEMARMMPKMLKKRNIIAQRRKVSSREMRHWFS